MSAKNIIDAIERNHAVMGAHVQRLSTVTPELKFQQPSAGGEYSPSSVSDLLNASVLGHLQGAANALRAMAEVESNFNTATRPETAIAPQTATIIDVEAITPDQKEGTS